jgi:hypothetical protein
VHQISCWVVTDGNVGTQNQCVGLAEALGLTPLVKRVHMRSPWRELSPWLRWGKRFALDASSDVIAPPWPDLVITSGRHAILMGPSIRQRSRGRTLAVHIQDPMISPRHFDLVAVPAHDRARGANVLVTRGALHRVTPAKLAAAAARLGDQVQHLPRPRIAVLVGGDNGAYRLTPTLMGDFAENLVALSRAIGAGFMVTPSRRTGADNEAILRARMREVPSVVWDGQGENPYFAYLGLADGIIVTCDSISMISEACSTGKPVYMVALEGDSTRFHKFHQAMTQAGMIRPFENRPGDAFESWSYPPLDDTEQVAAEVRRRLAARGALV